MRQKLLKKLNKLVRKAFLSSYNNITSIFPLVRTDLLTSYGNIILIFILVRTGGWGGGVGAFDKTHKMCDKAVDTSPFVFDSVPDQKDWRNVW